MQYRFIFGIGDFMKKKKTAFTLAEVLITFVIIGIIAAITVPMCIENYRKVSVPAKLKKFYSNSNNALRLWYVESGNYAGSYEFPEDSIRNGQKAKEFYDTTLGKYFINAQESKVSGTSNFCVPLNDGSGFCGYIPSKSSLHIFYCTEYKYCKMESFDGRNTFLFTLYLDKSQVMTSSAGYAKYNRQQLLNACKYGNSDNNEVSSNGRRHACTRLIETDGWIIKDDYPWRQSFLSQ